MIDELRYFFTWVVFDPQSRLYWLYIACYLIVGFSLFRYRQRISPSPGSLMAKLFPKHIYRHPSFLMDVKVLIVFYVFGRVGIFTGVIVSSRFLAEKVVSLLAPVARNVQSDISLWDRAVFTVVIIVAFDLAYFLVHFTMHKVRFLWAFHQIHHAAEHLTPLTSFRFHPVDNIVTYFVQTLLVTSAVSIFSLVHGTEVQLITLLNVSIAIFGFNLLSNFRHSHIWISYGPTLSKALISPCMHQIHHSCEPRHIDRNYGLIFSIWDKTAGSLYIPKEQETFRLGLLDRNLQSSDGLWKHLTLPFGQVWRSVYKRKSVKSTTAK